jgi:hypothetical protein
MDVAWRVDPALAVALLARYPSAAPARSHLEALVAANAHRPQVWARAPGPGPPSAGFWPGTCPLAGPVLQGWHMAHGTWPQAP